MQVSNETKFYSTTLTFQLHCVLIPEGKEGLVLVPSGFVPGDRAAVRCLATAGLVGRRQGTQYQDRRGSAYSALWAPVAGLHSTKGPTRELGTEAEGIGAAGGTGDVVGTGVAVGIAVAAGIGVVVGTEVVAGTGVVVGIEAVVETGTGAGERLGTAARCCSTQESVLAVGIYNVAYNTYRNSWNSLVLHAIIVCSTTVKRLLCAAVMSFASKSTPIYIYNLDCICVI